MAWIPITRSPMQYVDSNGDPYSGAVLKFYAEGTSTNISLATDDTGGTTATDVVLNSDGYPEISANVIIPHLDQDYKIALYPTQAAADADSGADWTVDNVPIGGANESEWQDSGLTPTFVSASSFTLSGDQTAEFHVGRRLQITDSGGTDYATIITSAFTTLTTVTVAVDGGGSIDSGISAVNLSILSADNPAVPPVWEKGADVASAADLDVTGVGNYFDVTGTTTITSIKGKNQLTPIRLHFDGALTLTHHATDLVLPGGANITTVAGDEAEFVEYAASDWRCVSYNGIPAVAATQAEQEAATSVTACVTPGRQHHHPGHPKAWVTFGVDGVIDASYGVSSLDDDGTGDFGVNFSTAFSAATYGHACSHVLTAEQNERYFQPDTKNTGSIEVESWVTATLSESGFSTYSVAVFGDQ